MFWQYEFDNHRFPSILTVQDYIKGLLSKAKKSDKIYCNSMHYPSMLNLFRLNRNLDVDEKDISCFYFVEDTLLVKTKTGISQVLSTHYPTLVRPKKKNLNVV